MSPPHRDMPDRDMPRIVRPTREELAAARRKRLRDVIAPGLAVLFCGINPGLYSAAVGHHFARPGNRFWPVLYRAGFTDRLLSPAEDRSLPRYGCGVTNVVARATAAADELTDQEFREGAAILERKVEQYAPAWVAFVGIGAYRIGFAEPRARMGEQKRRIGGARVWVLPSTSGLNANYRLEEMVRMFTQLRDAAGLPARNGGAS